MRIPARAATSPAICPRSSTGTPASSSETYNRNKRSLALDVRNPAGRTVFNDLVARSDAVFSNLRGDVPGLLGICYDDLKGLNPRIVCCSLSGFGMTGPRAQQPGYDYILQGLCGWMALTGDPDGPPTKSGLSMVDFSGGFVAAIALLTGIHAARRDGAGMDCDLSLYDTAISLLGYLGTWHLTAGFEPERVAESGHPSLVPFQIFEARDGWLVIGCAKKKFWQRLTQVLGRPELAEDPRFVDFAARYANKDELLAILRKAFRRPHRLGVAGAARRGRRAVRAHPGCARGAARSAHAGAGRDRRDRPSAPRDGPPTGHAGAGRGLSHRRTDVAGTGAGRRRSLRAQGAPGLR